MAMAMATCRAESELAAAGSVARGWGDPWPVRGVLTVGIGSGAPVAPSPTQPLSPKVSSTAAQRIGVVTALRRLAGRSRCTGEVIPAV